MELHAQEKVKRGSAQKQPVELKGKIGKRGRRGMHECPCAPDVSDEISDLIVDVKVRNDVDEHGIRAERICVLQR